MSTAMLVYVALLLGPVLQPGPGATCQPEMLTPQATEERVLAQFTAAIDAYVTLHRCLERSLPPEQIFDDAEDMFAARDALRTVIVAARPNTRQGNVFTPGVSRLLVDRLDGTIRDRGHDPADILAAINAERQPGIPEPEVNGEFPWVIGSAMWPTLLRALPPLPRELEYRFSNRDLVLIDVHANLVVDILDNALPQPAATGAR